MTVSELITRVNELVPISQVMSATRLINSLNRGYQYIARQSYGLRGAWTASVLADAKSVTIPTYILSLLTTTWTKAGETPLALTVRFWADAVSTFGTRELENPQSTSTSPTYLIVYGNTTNVLYPKPTSAGTINGTAIMIPSADATNPYQKLKIMTDSPALADDLHEAIALHTASELVGTDQSQLNMAKRYMNLRDDMVRSLISQQDDLSMEPVRMKPFSMFNI